MDHPPPASCAARNNDNENKQLYRTIRTMMLSAWRSLLLLLLFVAVNNSSAQDYPLTSNVTTRCLSCVKSGDQFFDFNAGNVCKSNDDASCPEFHRCCNSIECCATDGCRGPSDTFYIETNSSDISQDCTECQDEELSFASSSNATYIFGEVSYVIYNARRSVCQYRWDRLGSDFYDTITQTECVATYAYPPSLPKCATCTFQLIKAFHSLLQQLPTDVQCDLQSCSSSNQEAQNCEEPITTCECLCNLTYPFRMACPQLDNATTLMTVPNTTSAKDITSSNMTVQNTTSAKDITSSNMTVQNTTSAKDITSSNDVSTERSGDSNEESGKSTSKGIAKQASLPVKIFCSAYLIWAFL